MAGRPRRGDRVLRPRGDESEGGATPRNAGKETRVTSRTRETGELQSGYRLHAGGADAAGVPYPGRVPRVRWADPEPAARSDRVAHPRAPRDARPDREGGRHDRLAVERDEGEARLRRRDHP